MTVARSVSLRRPALLYRLGASKTGLVLGAVVIILALIGPWFAPESPSAIVGRPYEAPSSNHVLGTDFLGRDGLSRVLWGGRTVVLIAVCATALAYGVGLLMGLLAGFRRGVIDSVLMRSVDIVIAFPPIILLLLLVSGLGSSTPLLIGATALTLVPGIARVVRAATLEVSTRPFVEAAIVRGTGTVAIMRREIIPNIGGPLLADIGIRFTAAVLISAALNFLGLGLQPPSADWALMIGENRSGISINPVIVAVPALLIASLTIAGNLIADRVARSLGRSIDRQRIPK